MLESYRYCLEQGHNIDIVEAQWRPPRLALGVEDIIIIHFSGDVKMWDMFLCPTQDYDQRRALEHNTTDGERVDVEAFAEHILRDSGEGYKRWVQRTEPTQV